MINEMNYRFPMLVLNLFGNFTSSRKDANQAKSIASEAKQIALEGKLEKKHGTTAKTILVKATDAKQRQAFTAIAVWHYQRAAKKYAAAAEKLNSVFVLELSKRNKEYLESKRDDFETLGAEMNRQADEINKI